MEIALIGPPQNGLLDEGMKNYTFHVHSYLSKRHSVRIYNISSLIRSGFWSELKSQKPDIIHYIPGPSLISLIILKLLKSWASSITVASAIHPLFPYGSDRLVRYLLPDLVIATSQRACNLFAPYRGCTTVMLPNGVDTSRFNPVSTEHKISLRLKLGLPTNKYIILHVGHIRNKRGIKSLVTAQIGEQQVLLVGSIATRMDSDVKAYLEQNGCLVWVHYIPDIEEIYALSDCYLFPTQDSLSAIEIPLSVLEAMSCNLPVITYPFGGLPDFIEPGQGLLFCESPQQWQACLDQVRNDGFQIKTRDKVLPFDWQYICARLESFYQNALKQPI